MPINSTVFSSVLLYDLSASPSGVPCLRDAAYICADLPHDVDNIRCQLTEAIRDYGRVLSRPPVQITDILQRPAALLVHWADVSASATASTNDATNDAGSGPDGADCPAASGRGELFDVYRLQVCRGKVFPIDCDAMTASFTDVYQGPSTSYLVTSLEPSIQYTLRVCGGSYSDGSGAWSAWSLPVTWTTTLPRRCTYVCASFDALLVALRTTCSTG